MSTVKQDSALLLKPRCSTLASLRRCGTSALVSDRIVLGPQVPFADLWEFDLERALLGQPPFRKIEYSPPLGGLFSPVAVVPAGESHRLLMVGGSAQGMLESLLFG